MSTDKFTVNSGLKQGDLSAILFNIVLEQIIRASRIKAEGTMLKGPYQCIAYANDVTLISRTKELKQAVSRLEKAAKTHF